MKSLFKKVKNKIFKDVLDESVESKGVFEDGLRHKIRADPSDHSFTIVFTTELKRGRMVDLYKSFAGKFGEKRELDEMEKDTFDLPERFLGLLHGKMGKIYKTIEAETKRDFQAKGKSFRFTIINTRSMTFTKLPDDRYEVLLKTDGYWSGS